MESGESKAGRSWGQADWSGPIGHGELHIIETDTCFSEVWPSFVERFLAPWLPHSAGFKLPGLRVPPRVFLAHCCGWSCPSPGGSVFASYLLSGAIIHCYVTHPYTSTLSSFLAWLLLEAGIWGAHFLNSQHWKTNSGKVHWINLARSTELCFL